MDKMTSLCRNMSIGAFAVDDIYLEHVSISNLAHLNTFSVAQTFQNCTQSMTMIFA